MKEGDGKEGGKEGRRSSWPRDLSTIGNSLGSRAFQPHVTGYAKEQATSGDLKYSPANPFHPSDCRILGPPSLSLSLSPIPSLSLSLSLSFYSQVTFFPSSPSFQRRRRLIPSPSLNFSLNEFVRPLRSNDPWRALHTEEEPGSSVAARIGYDT